MDGSNFASSRAFSFELALRMTTNLAETRRSLVQSLRKLAKTCKVPVEKLPKDTAGRQKVQALAATVAASAGPEDAKEQFSAEFLTYEKTWEPEPEEEAEAEDRL